MKVTRRDALRGMAAAATVPATPRKIDRPVRLGAIGNGKRGREVLATIRNGGLPCEFVAVCDIVEDHAQKAREACGASPEIYSDYRKLLERDDLDAVLISTPNFLHKEMAIASLERNLHVLCEKPMARTVEECDAMIDAWRSRNLIFFVGLQNRFHPLHVKVRELIQAGVVGDVKHLAATEFRSDWKKIAPGLSSASHVNWRHYDALSGGSLVEKHCHDFDLFSHWMGAEATDICGMGGTGFYPDRDSLDHASLALTYANGCTVSLDFNIGLRYGKGFHEWTLVGTKGQMFFRRKGDHLRVNTWEPKRETREYDIAFDSLDGKHNGTLTLVRAFFDAVTGKPGTSVGPLDGRASVQAAQAAEMAVRQRRVVAGSEAG